MLTRINGLVLRYLYLYRRSLARAGEIFFWPIMDLLVWGFVSTYINKENNVALFLLGSVIFWDVLYRSQQAITLSISEDIWVKNILNVFVSPVSIFELMVATCIMGIIKAIITAVVLGSLAFLLYTFNIVSFLILPNSIQGTFSLLQIFCNIPKSLSFLINTIIFS